MTWTGLGRSVVLGLARPTVHATTSLGSPSIGSRLRNHRESIKVSPSFLGICSFANIKIEACIFETRYSEKEKWRSHRVE